MSRVNITLTMKSLRFLLAFLAIFSAARLGAEEARGLTPAEILSASIQNVAAIIEPFPGAAPKTFSAKLKIIRGDGLPKDAQGREIDLAWQAPNRLRVAFQMDKKAYALGRVNQELWILASSKHFGVIGKPGLPPFSTSPDRLDTTQLPDWKLPLPREVLIAAPLLMSIRTLPEETIDGVKCHALRASPLPQAKEALKLPAGMLQVCIRQTDLLPARIGWSNEKGFHVQIELKETQFVNPWPEAKWKLSADAGDKIETVALQHLTRFADGALSRLNRRVPPLKPATGERSVVAREGDGRLEIIDGTKVLFLKGTPEAMGRQHGLLLKNEVRKVVNHILYGVGVGSSFGKGSWFLGEIEAAVKRFQPFVDPRYLQEMDALALAAGLGKEEIRLANFFPEMFHCSGFALFGSATEGGRMFHGRVLDYMKGIGLEENAVVTIFQPDHGHAWANVGYAGFIGSVTAMNEKHVAMGEMGGRGEGHWDGKPMAQLVREVMEKASNLEEAVEIMRRGPRTCEYYYVISDGKANRAVGIAATPTTFEVIQPNAAHPKLPFPIQDAIILSAGSRYEELVKRVKAGFGKFTADSARDLMTRPVCMNSNIHSVLFAPDTLDFWVANADSENVASHARYTKYNLGELLRTEPTAKQ